MSADLTLAGLDTCPTPTKKRYRSQAEANRHERQRYARRGQHKDRLYPYECASGGHWHLTHHTPERQATVFDKASKAAGLSAVSNSFEGYNVRHVIADEPIWIGRDVCEVIGVSKYRDALAQLDDDERVSVVVDTLGGPQQMTGVTEAGLWSLLLISRSPKVKPFKRWLTHEVIPAIRKTGRYDASIALPDRKTLAQWVVDAETRAELAEARAAELEPPAAAWNELADATGDYSVSDTAKVLSRDPNINTGERRLFAEMAAKSWIYRRDGRWRAYQSQVDNGRLVEKLNRPYVNSAGETWAPAPTIRVTAKGIAALHQILGGSARLALTGAVQ